MTAEQKKTALELYLKGLSIRNISKILCFSEYIINKYLRSETIIKNSGFYSRKYICNDNYFEEIDAHQKAYWLGFLYADGCVTKIKTLSVILHEKDVLHLEKLKLALEATNPIEIRHENIRDKEGNLVRIQDCCKLRISSIKLCDDLIKLGCVQQKTKILEFPTLEQVTEEFLVSFILGYFDGDGSVYFYYNEKQNREKYGFSVTSTWRFLQGLKFYLEKLFDVKSFLRNHKSEGIGILEVHSKVDIRKFFQVAYENCPVSLDRKKEIVSKFNNLTIQEKLVNKRQLILKTIKENGPINKREISDLLKVSLASAATFLYNCIQDNILVRIGKSLKFSKYAAAV